jgi:diguanylate cyclase
MIMNAARSSSPPTPAPAGTAVPATPAPRAPDSKLAIQAKRWRHKALQWPGNLIAGTDPKMRLARGLCFLVMCLYLVWMAALYWVALPSGLLPMWLGHILLQQQAIAALAFYPLVRSGLTRKWSDPALVIPQMMWTSAAAIVTYAGAPSLRSVALETLCLIQVFGFVGLRPVAARWLGALSIAMLLGMTVLMVRRHTPLFDWHAEILPILASCGIIGLFSWMSARFAGVRQQVSRKRRALKAAMDSAKLVSLHDTLTGLPNRQFLQERIESELKRAARTSSRFSVALLDLDHFKQVNDTHGHHVGDEVLITFAKTARKSLRETDVIGRWGGEEFVMLLLDTDPAPLGLTGLDRIRAVLAHTVASKQASTLRVRFSAGLTCSRAGETLEQLMERADKALYEAKSSGRNRTCIGD